MENKKNNLLKDEQLEKVVGGSNGLGFSGSSNYGPIYPSSYTCSKEPRYTVGQRVKVHMGYYRESGDHASAGKFDGVIISVNNPAHSIYFNSYNDHIYEVQLDYNLGMNPWEGKLLTHVLERAIYPGPVVKEENGASGAW